MQVMVLQQNGSTAAWCRRKRDPLPSAAAAANMRLPCFLGVAYPTRAYSRAVSDV